MTILMSQVGGASIGVAVGMSEGIGMSGGKLWMSVGVSGWSVYV
jgi:hypothetical protein